MKILSLFDGMSCGQIALNRAGIKYDNYYASEIDKHSIKVTHANYPDTVQLGDIERWQEWGIDWAEIGLIMAGSPCQGFSFAGKQLAFDDPRSKLFFVFVDILRFVQNFSPDVKFLLENVKMKKEHQQVITDILGVEPVEINSALVSAQNRRRLYWANWEFKQPEDKGILLRDIVQASAEKKYFLSETLQKKYRGNERINPDYKSRANKYIIGCKQIGNLNDKNTQDGRVYSTDAKSPTLRSHLSGGSDSVKILQAPQSNNLGGICAEDEKTLCLSANSWQDGNYPTCEGLVRKLTPLECERLQTVPDDYTACVSDTQRYRMLGNGWTVDIVANILAALAAEGGE